MAYASECSIQCDPKRRGQVDSAASELEDTVGRVGGLVLQLRAQLEPVLAPPNLKESCNACDNAVYATPLAGNLQSVDAQLRMSEEVIRDLLIRLEI